MARAFEKFIAVPSETGVIMIIEKEFGVAGARDWASIAKGHANIVKITFGTGALYDETLLKQKIAVYKNAGVSPMVGGTLTEVAILGSGGYSTKAFKDYLKYARTIGFTHIEFSDGTIYIPDNKRGDIIKMCLDNGFSVLSEVGKKDPKKDAQFTTGKRIELMKQDLKNGSSMVIIEAREGGKGIGVMDEKGKVRFAELDMIIHAVGLDKTMIEAPDKDQQQTIYMRYGAKANIGNVQPKDVIAASALRAGLRGDTISIVRAYAWKEYHSSQNAPADYNV